MPLRVTWDRGLWLYLPVEFPWQDYPTEAAWISTVVGAFRRAKWKRRELADLALYLEGLRANNRVGAHRFAWLADPRRVLQAIDIHETPHDPDLTLHDVTGSDGIASDARDAVVSEVVAAGLGPGHRVERALRVPITTHERLGPGDGPTEVILMVFWMFRSRHSDVVVTVTSKDPIKLATLMPEIERLIDGVVIEPEEAELS